MHEDVPKWFDKAEEDAAMASVLIASDHFAGAMFHCQQAMEKALKGLLLAREGHFPKTHDLVALSTLAKASARIGDSCRAVSPAYAAVRYPDVAMVVSQENAEAFLGLAREVVDWARRQTS